MSTLAEQCVRAQLARCLRGHRSWDYFWGWCEAAVDAGGFDGQAARLALIIDGLIAAHLERGEWSHRELIAHLRRVARYIPIHDGAPVLDSDAYRRHEDRRARKVRSREAMGTIWRLRLSQYVLGCAHRHPERDPALPLTIEECGSLWRMEASGAYRKGKPPTAAQNEYLSREHRSMAAKDAADRHFLAVKEAIAANLPVPSPVLVSYPALIPEAFDA